MGTDNTGPELRHDGDIDEAVAKAIQITCPNCESDLTSREIPWIPCVLLVCFVPFLNSWLAIPFGACIVIILINPNRYCKHCGTRFRSIPKPKKKDD